LLLGEAVEGAESPDEVDGVDADDVASGKAGGDGVEGDAVLRVVEGGDEDERVGDVEVGVAGGESLAFEDDGRGHGQGEDAEGLAVEIAEGVEAVQVLGEREVVLVGGVGFDAGEDGVGFVFRGRDEAGDVVDVAVGVVAGAAAMQPEGLMDAEVVVEGALQLLAADSGVALLDLREEALLSGEQNARAVGVDGAAFEDYAMGLRVGIGGKNFGLDLGEVIELGDVVGNLVVEMPVRVLGPGVELPVGDGEVGVGIFDGANSLLNKDRAGVAEPDAVCGPAVEVDAGEVGSATTEYAGGAALGGEMVDEDVDVFDGG